jgi:hypothetical protein
MKKNYKLTYKENSIRGKQHIRNVVLVLILPLPCGWCVKFMFMVKSANCEVEVQKFALNCYYRMELSSLFIKILQNIKQNYGKEQLGVKVIWCIMDH